MSEHENTPTRAGEGESNEGRVKEGTFTLSIADSEQSVKENGGTFGDNVTPIRPDVAMGPGAPDVGQYLHQRGLVVPLQQPERWSDAMVQWEIGHDLEHYARPVTNPKTGQVIGLAALDASYWAARVAEIGQLGWYHDDLYGLPADGLIFQPVHSHIEQFVEQLANALRDQLGTQKLGTSRKRQEDVIWHLKHGSLPRPSAANWLAWDREHWNLARGIPFKNGLLDLDTLILRNITPADRLTWEIPFDWVATLDPAVAQFWLQHFKNLFGTGTLAQSKIQTLLVRSAVALTPWVRGARWQKALMLVGPGENGKGTWIRLWQHILGTMYQSMALAGYDSAATFGLGGLSPDTLIAATPDMDTNAALKGTERFKNLTGDDPIVWERKHRDIVTTQFRARVWLAGPVVPQVQDSSDGMFRRLDGAIISFDRKQPKDDGYEQRMLTPENVQGLLHLAITALSAVVDGSKNMPRPEDSDELLAEYRQRVSPLDQWLGEEGWLVAVEGPDAAKAFTSTDRLYQVYRHWYQHYTGDRFPKYMSRVAFGKKLASRFSSAQPTLENGLRPRGYAGLKIQPDWDRTWADDER